MKKNIFRTVLFGAMIASLSLASCSKSDGPDTGGPDGEDDGTRWITVVGSVPNAAGVAGNGGNLVYAISPEDAADPNYEVNIFSKDGSGEYNVGFRVKSSRTARIQASEDGKFLYNIQYGNDNGEGGVFNKYRVSGEGKYEEDGFELNTSTILGTNPRWNKVVEGTGVGVFGPDNPTNIYTGTTVDDIVFQKRTNEILIATIDLDNTAITNTGRITVEFPEELAAQGYAVGRIDVPRINKAQDKLFIGCNVSKIDPNQLTVNSEGVPSWANDNDNRTVGTTTLVVDFPSLRNPKLIMSEKSILNNHGYRTTTQYVGTDGHLYQGAIYHGNGDQILRISSATNDYDNSYEFSLNTALGIDNAGIAAWRYIQDGIGVVLYRKGGEGGYLAVVDLNAGTATALATDIESDTDLHTVLGQYQNITAVGDYAYVPLAPTGKDGNLYVINWKTKTIAKGAKLKNDSGSFYIGAH